MTTANDLIKRAYRTAGILGDGEIPSSGMASDGLVYLNDLIEGLSNEHLMIFQDEQEDITLTNQIAYTWGTGGDISTTRPIKLSSGYYTQAGEAVDYPITVLTKDEYDGISFKSTTGDVVDYVYLYTDYPLATLYVYPQVPTGTLTLTSWKQLDSVASLTTSLSLPPGWERMLRYNLALELVDEYGMAVPPNLAQKAAKAKADIKRVNSKRRMLSVELPIYNRHSQHSDIERGY